ncbi:hypothetical protein GCM10009566_15740 [Streptomyces murinus]|uniref:Uncharacterized protein n=1 Tax=Actinocorallia cavernae TaxID=328075 RepID=A0ABP8SQV7_9ACTN
MGPPTSSLPAAATSSSRVGRTGSGGADRSGSGSYTPGGVISALGMGHILPYLPMKTRRAAAPGGCGGRCFT